MYIACPRCDWHPTPDVKWTCSCGHRWHTFDTHGICPACSKVWRETQCSTALGCGVWSDHEEWYHDDEGLTVEDYIANPLRIVIAEPVEAPPSGSGSGGWARRTRLASGHSYGKGTCLSVTSLLRSSRADRY